MKSTQTKTLLVIALAAVVSLWALPMIAGGKAETSPSARAIMRPCGAGDCMRRPVICEREGYTECFIVNSEETETILTVPDGERFVLLRLYIRDWESPSNDWRPWKLTVDDRLWLSAMNMIHPISDFPDGCVVVNGGETLKAIRGNADDVLIVTLIGYFQRMPQGPGIRTNR